MKDAIKVGFTYKVDAIKDGVVIDTEIVTNLVPEEGISHILNVIFNSAAAQPNWYIGLFVGDYTPASTDTMASLIATAIETTAYSEATRPQFVSGAEAAGSVDNSASPALFSINAPITVYGGFICPSATKGSTSGPAISVVRFASPKVLDVGVTFRVTAGVAAASA
jgi:hypothetical protein